MSSTYAKIGSNLKARQKRLLPERTKWALDTLGNECFFCSSSEDLKLSRINKGPSFGSLWGHSLEYLSGELENFILVCSTCLSKNRTPRTRLLPTEGSQTHNTKESQLGMKLGTASNKLRRLVMWDLLVKLKLIYCYRCGLEMSEESYSIEHKIPWLGNDTSLFWDMDNISFSHLSCNVKHSRASISKPISIY